MDNHNEKHMIGSILDGIYHPSPISDSSEEMDNQIYLGRKSSANVPQQNYIT